MASSRIREIMEYLPDDVLNVIHDAYGHWIYEGGRLVEFICSEPISSEPLPVACDGGHQELKINIDLLPAKDDLLYSSKLLVKITNREYRDDMWRVHYKVLEVFE